MSQEYEESPDQQQTQEQTQGGRRRPSCLMWGGLAILIGLAFLYPFLRFAGSGGTGSGFDATPSALELARAAYQERAKHAPTGHDFGGGMLVLQYADGSAPRTYPSPVYEGYDSPQPDPNKTHSERRAWDEFLLPTLTIFKHRGALTKASEIDLVIFTQFYPCVPCQAEMRAWQKLARTVAGTQRIWRRSNCWEK